MTDQELINEIRVIDGSSPIQIYTTTDLTKTKLGAGTGSTKGFSNNG